MTKQTDNIIEESINIISLSVTIITFLTYLLLALFIEMTEEGAIKSILSAVNNLIANLVASALIATIISPFISKAIMKKIEKSQKTINDIVENKGLRSIKFDQDFATIFRQGKQIDIFLAYGTTQRRGLESVLREIANKKTTNINIILPNPNNEDLMNSLKIRFSKPNIEAMKNEIETAKNEWFDFFSQKQGKIYIYYTDTAPMYSYYRVDKCIVIAMYKHKKERGQVPYFELTSEGELGKYFIDEFNYIKDNAESVK